MDRHILFKCPQVGMNVQHRISDEPDDEVKNEYIQVICPACTRLHLINRKTGKLLGDK